MNKLQITKTVTSTIVGVGTGKIVATIIQNNVHPETTTDKVAVAAASFALGSMIADKTREYTNAKIDEIAKFVNENFKK
jgi:hypothetical protein